MSLHVVDASVAIKWYVPEIHTEDALRMLEPGNELHVPDLLYAEAGNILWKKRRRGELSGGDVRRVLRALLSVPLTVHPSAMLLEGALDVATRMDRTVYDGMYVALAVALGGPLVTADRRLANSLEKTPLRPHVMWVEDVP